MAKITNPFQYGREIGTDALVDRQQEVAEVVNTIEEAGKLFLVGPRRYGKTSILAAAQEQAERAQALVLRFDAEAYPTLEMLISVVLAEATKRLTGGLEKATERFKQLFARLKPQINYNLLDQSVTATIGAETDPTQQPAQVPLLIELLNGLEQLAAQSQRPVGLILDEFQKVIELGGDTAEAQIRAAIQRHRHVGYVFAGSKTRMMADMTGNPSRPFYHLGERRFIGAIPRADFSAFLQDNFSHGKIKAVPAAIELIQDLAEDVPYNIQRLAHACWDQLFGVTGARLTEEAVQSALAALLREDDTWYTQLWNQLTTVQKTALLHALRTDGTALLAKPALRATGLSASSLQRALQALQDREILRTEEKLGSVRLRLIDPFFRHWIQAITK